MNYKVSNVTLKIMQLKSKPHIRQISSVDLKLLYIFKAVADCGGLSAAESELNLALSTISRHLTDLEQRLGLELCRRGRSGFLLTVEGTKVYQATIELLAATESFRRTVYDMHQSMQGELNVGIFENTSTNPESRIPEALARFHEVAPNVELRLHVAGITTLEQGVLNGQFQLAVLPTNRQHDSIFYDELFDEEMILCVGTRHPWFEADHSNLDWDDLRHQKLAALDYLSPSMMLAHDHGLIRSASGSDQEAVLVMILSGRFVGFLPSHLISYLVQSEKLKGVSKEKFNYKAKYYCARRRSPQMTRVVSAFHEALLSVHKSN
ncbi:LysR family transcriptional regulator [Sulfitobacter sp. NFXS29]|uniref:LysR family transcriptional regulator n=1 Tax=Sulfitobacter sp. NFXS29 TaxID=2818438 RepID=UPI0032DE5C87